MSGGRDSGGSVPDHGSDDVTLIEAHRQRVQHLLLPMVARYEFGEMGTTPEGRAVLGAAPELRPSLAVAALAGPRSGWTAAIVTEVPWSDQWAAELIRSLVRSRIDWDASSAALAIRLVAATDFDDERIQLAVKASDQVAAVHPGHQEVLDALALLQQRVDETSTHRYRVPEMRARVRTAIAHHTPPELLDLSPVSTEDSWGPLARDVIALAHERGCGAGAVLRALLASPAASTPSATWRRGVEAVLHTPLERRLVRDLVRLLVDADLDPGRPFVAAGNDAVARGAVWALAIPPGHGSDEVAATGEAGATGAGTDRLAEVLGDVVLAERVADRCSRTNGQPYVTEALCGRAVGAAVAVLSELSDADHGAGGGADRQATAAAHDALERLWLAIDRGDVLKRIGAALGRTPEEIAARQREVKRAKEVERRRKADPRPAERQALLREVIQVDLAARLAAHGFVDRTGKTFRRSHVRNPTAPDRTDVVAVSTADAMVQVRFGVAFHGGTDQRRFGIDHCDIAAELALTSSDPSSVGISLDGTPSPWLAHQAVIWREHYERRARRGDDDPIEVLARLVERFETHGLPALARWSRPAVVADDLEDLPVPFRHGMLLLGLDLPGSIDREAAVVRLRSLGGT